MYEALNSTAYEALDELGFSPVLGIGTAAAPQGATVFDPSPAPRLTYELREVAPRPAHAVAAVYQMHRPAVTRSHSPAGVSALARRVVRAIGR